jgi:Holliday junction resolvase
VLERDITKSIKDYLKKNNWYVVKIAGGRFQQAGLPDLLAIKNGVTVFLEVKRPLKYKISDIQTKTINDLKQAGVIAEIVFSVEDVKKIISGI